MSSETENERRGIDALREFAFPGISADVFNEPDAILRMGVSPLRIEVFKSIAGVEFEDCWSRRVTFDVGDFEIPMISLEDLLTNKRAAGRLKDLVDVAELS